MSFAATATRTNQTQSNSNYDTSGQALVLRPKGKGPNARRDVYDNASRRYMSDLRPQHEQTNTLLAMVNTATMDEHFKNSKGTSRKRKPATQKQGNTEMFPTLGNPAKTNSLTWVTPSSSTTNDAFTGTLAPVPESKKVSSKPKMQVLSKTTTNDAVDNLNFQEEKEKLLADIEKWQQVAEERAKMLDDMEWEISRLRRELDDAYDRCN